MPGRRPRERGLVSAHSAVLHEAACCSLAWRRPARLGPGIAPPAHVCGTRRRRHKGAQEVGGGEAGWVGGCGWLRLGRLGFCWVDGNVVAGVDGGAAVHCPQEALAQQPPPIARCSATAPGMWRLSGAPICAPSQHAWCSRRVRHGRAADAACLRRLASPRRPAPISLHRRVCCPAFDAANCLQSLCGSTSRALGRSHVQ